MLKKIGFVTAGTAAGLLMMSGLASASEEADYDGYQNDPSDYNQVGLINLNNTNVLDNVSIPIGVCDNNINIIAIQVPIEDVLNGVGVPIASPGNHDAEGQTPENCSSSSIEDGGTVQDN